MKSNEPIRHLKGEPSPEALFWLSKQLRGRKERRALTIRYFGKGKPGPKGKLAMIEHRPGVIESRYVSIRRRYRRYHLEPEFSGRQLKDWVIKQFGANSTARCAYCDWPIDLNSMHIEHRVPIKRGGSLGLDNLALACRACNMRKGQMTDASFRNLIAFVNDPDKCDAASAGDLLHRLLTQLPLAISKQNADRK